MASADRSLVCMCVRYAVQARRKYRIPPAARAGVSSACTAGAVLSSSRARSVNPLSATSAAALPRMPAIQPVDAATPAISRSSTAARPTGM